MTNKIKRLGLALVAALALGAVAASSAFAVVEFHAEEGGVTLTGSQPAPFNDHFGSDAGVVECQTITYTGGIPGAFATETEIRLFPTFTGCIAGFVGATIDVNGCAYILHSDTRKVDIACGPGAKIEVTVTGCVTTIGSQANLDGVTVYTNEGAGANRAVTPDLSINGIAYEEHNKGFFPTCANNTVAKNNGTFAGRATITAEKSGAQKGFWVQ